MFHENQSDDKSVVLKQPESEEEWQNAKRAILSCPTNSIGVKNAPEMFRSLGPGLPLEIADHVFYLGYTSRDSFGATSYLIQRPEGNILIDSPRFHPWLIKELDALGEIKFMLLTHQDDVADHKKFHAHFDCERIIHQDDVNNDTTDCERIISGRESIQLDRDIKIIMTPGHTKGHINIIYKNKFLFTGDHLFVEEENHDIRASHGVCWYSWEEQIQSVEKLLKEEFEWIMPGHGGWGFFGKDQAHRKIQSLVSRMRKR